MITALGRKRPGAQGRARRRRDARRRAGDRCRARPRGLLRLRHRPQQPGSGPSEIGRPETIEETGELMTSAGGTAGARRRPRGSSGSRRAGRRHRARPGPARRAGQRHLRRRPLHGVGQAALGARLGGRPTDAADGRAHAPDHVAAAIPLLLLTAEAHGTRGLVVEMTDGTSQANADFRRNVGFYYDLVKANVERIVIGLSAELETAPSRSSASHRAGCAPRRCWTTSA